MATGPRPVSTRRALLAACCIVGLAVLLAAGGGSAQAAGPIGPDVTVFDFTDIGNFGSSGGFAAYSLGTNACNRGDTPLEWCDQSSGCAPGATRSDHPVIAQNLYRLKNGRFEQVGMSWLKHGFASLNGTAAGCAGAAGESCQVPPAGDDQLGVGCIDPYVASTNGRRPLGPRSEVNATTGAFPYPYSSPGGPYTTYDQRIKVAAIDVNPADNPGALYWIEGHYIASDDAASGNGLNNASHRQVTVGGGPTFELTMTGTFFESQPAIFSWPTQDPTVDLVHADVPGAIVERFHVARKVTALGGGLWHYEYAVHNLSSDRSARAFSVDFPEATTFTNVGSKAIAHHSGEPYATGNWLSSSSGSLLSWSTDTFAVDPNANALRFATTFNFWFDADQPPTSDVVHTLGLFKPGTPSSIQFQIVDGIFGDGFEAGNDRSWSGSVGNVKGSRRAGRRQVPEG